LVPATDNRIQADAYAAGDVLRMHNGTTVEIINTDAEGRLLLADALSYASRWNPGLVVDLATLTGAAAVAIGKYGCVGMGTHAEALEHLTRSGEATHERVAPFPFWEEYDELIKGEVADLRNLGGSFAGAITAGKFLSHFVTAPWVHLDIAGPAFVDAPWNYRGKGATGYGVRLLLHFIHHHFTTLS
jgi:leucyl aminopeptidase